MKPFRAPVFAYDEALRLARAVGVDLEGGVVGRVAGKKGSDLHLWDSARRAAAGALGPADGSRGMIDALHHAAHAARGQSVAAAAELLARAGLDREPRFLAALEAVLEILPPSKTFTGIALEGAVEASGSDFEALYNLLSIGLRRPDRRTRPIAPVAGGELTQVTSRLSSARRGRSWRWGMKNRIRDPIVAEVTRVRAELAAKHGNDVAAIILHAQALERASGRDCVRYPARRAVAAGVRNDRRRAGDA